jgi:hypothetical protein
LIADAKAWQTARRGESTCVRNKVRRNLRKLSECLGGGIDPSLFAPWRSSKISTNETLDSLSPRQFSIFFGTVFPEIDFSLGTAKMRTRRFRQYFAAAVSK